ncbi:hypothetical protein PTKIN_Ptkin15bG0063600 [Pterospermum kingtungense]
MTSSDIKICHFSSDGTYTVRSEYRLAMDSSLVHEELKANGNWCDLYKFLQSQELPLRLYDIFLLIVFLFVVVGGVDAVIFQTEQITGFGMVLCDEAGSFFHCRTCTRFGLLLPREVEAIGLLEALYWARGLGWDYVIFELDALSVVAASFKNTGDETEFGSFIAQNHDVLHQQNGFQVYFVKRQVNDVAHSLARFSLSYASPTI